MENYIPTRKEIRLIRRAYPEKPVESPDRNAFQAWLIREEGIRDECIHALKPYILGKEGDPYHIWERKTILDSVRDLLRG